MAAVGTGGGKAYIQKQDYICVEKIPAGKCGSVCRMMLYINYTRHGERCSLLARRYLGI